MHIGQYNTPIQPQGPGTPQPPVQSPSVSSPNPAASEQKGSSPEATVPLALEDLASLNGAATYNFAEKDVSFTASLNETSRIRAAQAVQAVSLETEDPYALGAAQMLAEEGKAAFRAGDFETAALFYEAAREYDPKSAVLAYNLGCCYQECGDREKSLQMFETAIALDPLNLELKQRIEKRTTL